jgi:thioredoxin reductase (NADPH)
MVKDLIIIGSGPAGYTAAVYAGRAGLETVLFEGDQLGGQLMTTTDVENFPGFPRGVQGPDLMLAMRDQAARFGCEMVPMMVTKVDFSKRPFRVTAGERVEEANAVIVATGASARRLGLESETKLYGKGVSACATCDGPFFKGKHVVVVGGGDSAMEESMFLTRFADAVTLLVRGDKLRASPIMQERAKNNPKIAIVFNTEVTEVLGAAQGRVSGVKVKSIQTGEERELPCEGLFTAIGHTPNTALFEGQLETDRGYAKVTAGTSLTSVPGVFACGDVQDFRYRQAITAAGSGCMAALDAQRYLEQLEAGK